MTNVDLAPADDAEDSEQTPDVLPVEVPLPSGELLDLDGLNTFLRARSAILVCVVGERDSGKTTLITTIYDQFLRGPFAGYAFMQSKTLIGFEQWSHASRLASGRSDPDTPHTSVQEDLRFFHLAMAPDSGGRIDLMLSDRAGESYKHARDTPDACKPLIEVAAGDVVVFLLDGKRAADATERPVAFAAVRNTLRALLDASVLTDQHEIQVVTTKVDRIDASGDVEAIRAAIATFQAQVKEQFEQRVRKLSFFDIAARDPSGATAPAKGVALLVESWLHRDTPKFAFTSSPPPLRWEFDRLLSRPSKSRGES